MYSPLLSTSFRAQKTFVLGGMRRVAVAARLPICPTHPRGSASRMRAPHATTQTNRWALHRCELLRAAGARPRHASLTAAARGVDSDMEEASAVETEALLGERVEEERPRLWSNLSIDLEREKVCGGSSVWACDGLAAWRDSQGVCPADKP
jgi:hypothetical protein